MSQDIIKLMIFIHIKKITELVVKASINALLLLTCSDKLKENWRNMDQILKSGQHFILSTVMTGFFCCYSRLSFRFLVLDYQIYPVLILNSNIFVMFCFAVCMIQMWFNYCWLLSILLPLLFLQVYNLVSNPAFTIEWNLLIKLFSICNKILSGY